MRLLYSIALYVLSPLFVLHLLWRGLRARDYWRRWGERFGFPPLPEAGGALWLHAVSVGEFQAALPLINALRERYPDLPMLITTTTPTGSRRVLEALDGKVMHVYMPYDLPCAVRRFLGNYQPSVAVFIETEIWPNLYAQCKRRGIPLILANARMSERSARGYARLGALSRETLECLSAIAAQSESDARRLIKLGAPAERVVVTGSVKFDISLPASLNEEAQVLRRDLGVARPVWIAASTHAGEDEIVLDAFAVLRERIDNALLILVPRHPERFDKVAALCEKRGYCTSRRSSRQACAGECDVFLGDTMGELPLFYAASDAAFVGGSLIETGGHNPLEPAALGLPVVSGPHVFNFQRINELLSEAGALSQVHDAGELAERIGAYLSDANLRHAHGERGREVVERNRGALRALLEMIGERLA